MMDKFKNKSKVFDISLNEIAFILIFILLLLLGSLYIFKSKEVDTLHREINDYRDSVGTLSYLNNVKTELMRTIESNSPQDEKDFVNKILDKRIDLAKYEQLEIILNNLGFANDIKYIDNILVSSQEKQNLKDLKILYDLINKNLAECKNPEQFISNMILKDECNTQKLELLRQLAEVKDQLQQRQDELKKFETLQQELSNKKIDLEDAFQLANHQTIKDKIQENNQLLDELKKQEEEIQQKNDNISNLKDLQTALLELDKLQTSLSELDKFKELQTTLSELNIDLDKLPKLAKENNDLKGQLEYIQNKLKGNGLDHPPCWASQAGKIEYLFHIDMYPNYLQLTPIWPEYRNEDAAKLPNINRLTNANLSYGEFQSLAYPIFEVSKNSEPQCRFFVRIQSHIPTAKESDEARFKIETLFYKLEVR